MAMAKNDVRDLAADARPNPCTMDRIRPAPCSGAMTAIAPTAKPARTIILTTMLLEIEAE
jgi:hypothetical protein